MKSLVAMLERVAERYPAKAALMDGQREVTYAELRGRIGALARRLHAGGVRPGDRVAILLPNSPQFVTGYFAAVTLGAIAVPLHHEYQRAELLQYFGDCTPSALITSPGVAAGRSGAVPSGCRVLLADTELPTADAAGISPEPPVRPDDPVMYQYSSGSTGRPKRVARTHAKLLFELDRLVDTLGIGPDDRLIGIAPFSHVNGLMRSMLVSLRAGATLYPLPNFRRRGVAETVQTGRITVFIAVPFVFTMLAGAAFGHYDFSSLRLCISASAPLAAATGRQFRERFGIPIRQLYGSTETGTISVNLSPAAESTWASVGRPLPGVEVTLFREDGQLAGIDEVGEVAVRSPAMIQRYDGSADADRETFRDGYFLTGDLGRIDAAGLLYLLGRKKLLINRGGFKVNPREVESLLETHPSVRQAAVIGVPSSSGEERIKAVVVADGRCTEADIVRYCHGKIADFKIPSLVEFADALPLSQTGKVRRQALA
jgi:long-chain acyl-CoA synthetase